MVSLAGDEHDKKRGLPLLRNQGNDDGETIGPPESKTGGLSNRDIRMGQAVVKCKG